MRGVFYWSPRILAILFVGLMSIFALDVFSEREWFVPLVMHLIPSFILVIVTAVSWKYERFGGILFIASSLGMLFFYHSPVIATPALVIGVLFILSSFVSERKKVS